MNKFIIKYFIIFVSFISILFFSLVFFNKFMTEQMLSAGPNMGRPMQETPMGFHPSEPVQEAPMPPEPPTSVPLIFIIFVSSVFVLTVLKYIEKNFVKPLENIEENVKKIKEGNLNIEFKTKSENKTAIETFDTLNKMTEGLIQKEKLQNDFIRNIVHDLRAPIVASERAMDILEGEIDNELYEALKENSDSYLKLVNSIIETITKKEIKTEKITFSLLPLVNTVVNTLKFSIDSKNITIQKEISENFSIWADYVSVNRIILNLISNAIEHNENRTITIKAIDGDFSTVIIEDNGLGIKNPEELFKKHISINNSDKKMVSGLGLSIVKELTEANEGTIEVETEENKYTRFILKFPKKEKYEKN